MNRGDDARGVTPGPIVARIDSVIDPPWTLDDDLRPLRERFAALMDHMSQRLTSELLDSDDCVLERLATLDETTSGRSATVMIHSVIDADTIRKSFVDSILNDSDPVRAGQTLRVLAIALIARRAPDYPTIERPR